MLEVICETVQDAISAATAGADRIELVSALCDGGLTPSIALVEHVCNYVMIPVRVMLRPHARSFVYDVYDKDVILKDLEQIKKTKAEGVVFGALTNEGHIDEPFLKDIISNKGSLKLTFHRAIDEATDYHQALEVLTQYPVNAILTSGGCLDAIKAIPIYNQHKNVFTHHQVECLAGKGITLENLEQLLKETSLQAIHMGSGLQSSGHVDPEKVANARKIMDQHIL